jgi:hypothetical protein
MPVATETPVRSVSGSISNPESSSAIRAAARIICVKRSIRRALRCSIHFVGSKPFSSHAKCTANSDGSNALIGPAPPWPSTRFAQNVSTSLPRGVTAPMPVITTRLSPLTEANT